MPAEMTEFKGNKMIRLRRSDEDKYPFQFGLSKAKLVLAHIEDIKKFVNGEELEEEPRKEPKEGEFM